MGVIQQLVAMPGTMIFLILLYVESSFGLDLPLCPYPLAEDIEPCVCQVDEEYRMILTCHFRGHFMQESFQNITGAFDYNNNIFSFDINLNYNAFYPQLDKTNLGKLNITHFSLRDFYLDKNLFGEGAFSGSAGSITNITILSSGAQIDLTNNVLHPACPTLKYLNIEHAYGLSSTVLTLSPKLEEISFTQGPFQGLPPSLFSSQIVPNVQSITVGVLENGVLNIQTDTFKNLEKLTNLEIPTNILNVEEDSFKDLLSLEAIEISRSSMENLPRIFTNSPSLTSFYITKSRLKRIEENAFSGVPSLKILCLDDNQNLNHQGLGSSLHFIADPDAVISLRNTNVRNLDEFVFRPLLELFISAESSAGYIDMAGVSLDCGCDVKWIIMDSRFKTSYFKYAMCTGGGYLADVDPILLEMMCPP